ncbi:19735_t:CDS:2, partial [Cetraspora pellucida]
RKLKTQRKKLSENKSKSGKKNTKEQFHKPSEKTNKNLLEAEIGLENLTENSFKLKNSFEISKKPTRKQLQTSEKITGESSKPGKKKLPENSSKFGEEITRKQLKFWQRNLSENKSSKISKKSTKKQLLTYEEIIRKQLQTWQRKLSENSSKPDEKTNENLLETEAESENLPENSFKTSKESCWRTTSRHRRELPENMKFRRKLFDVLKPLFDRNTGKLPENSSKMLKRFLRTPKKQSKKDKLI